MPEFYFIFSLSSETKFDGTWVALFKAGETTAIMYVTCAAYCTETQD